MIDLEGSVYAQRHQQGVEGCCKTAEDLARYRKIIRTMRPDGILEMGSYSGKSALWLAREAGCEVMSVDISDLPTKDPDVMAEAARLGVTFVTLTRTTSQQALEQAVYWSVGRSRIMVSLDSDHSAETVHGEMEMYHRFVPVGGYMVVEDGIIRWVPEQLPYYQDSSPLDAIEAWLPSHPNWEQDMALEDCYPITNFPGGFLRRTR